MRGDAKLNLAGQTPYEVIAEQDIVRLRYYAPDSGSDKPAIVVVPPLAVNMLIYDLFPQRSLVAWFRDQGYPLYLIDWGRPGRAQGHYRFATYLQDFMPKMLSEVRRHSAQQQLILHGWSIGAMLSYAYTALGDPDISRLILLGPPCDYHAPGMLNRHLARPLQRLRRLTGWHVYRSPRGLWHVPGWANTLAYKMVTPEGTIRGYLDLIARLDDDEFVRAHTTNAAFLDDMVAYPAGVMQDIVHFLMTNNVLAQGRLPIRDCEATLQNIRAKVLLVVGDKDPIITPNASQRLIELISNANCDLLEVPGGHMGIVSGSKAPQQIWPQVHQWIEKGQLAAEAA